ncbi:MAG TPA: SigE family RNA polymerase sigma factor [Actinomycetota bacterium]|nr:SigE family RNA polymerase sigma factor [Actinomycetota bacterium]
MVLTVDREERRTQEHGLEALYRAHAAEALRLGYLLTGDRLLAEDLVQDAFVRVLGRFRDLRNKDAFWWYLRRTIVNLSSSTFRRRRVERGWLASQRADEAAPADGDVGERDRLRHALMKLRPEQRAAIVLRFYEDLSESDTAEALGVPLGTVKSTVSRGLERLRKALPDDAEDER